MHPMINVTFKIYECYYNFILPTALICILGENCHLKILKYVSFRKAFQIPLMAHFATEL